MAENRYMGFFGRVYFTLYRNYDSPHQPIKLVFGPTFLCFCSGDPTVCFVGVGPWLPWIDGNMHSGPFDTYDWPMAKRLKLFGIIW